ncbi:MAG: hypothetical protein A2284_02220 [Deltaproteobacteria bacterium RIFOXYA12_FULL_61_11]|nr:MAG: hypothetical protein A2284_02220 [Deltaproteobacteria bacterium RIFOXYA12_FULL_61_11]
MVLVCSIVYLILGYYFYTTSLDNTDLLAVRSFELKGVVEAEDNFTLLALLIAFVVQVGSLFVLGTLLTHRIVGPTFVIARALDNLSTGRYQFMRPLRKKDEFHEFIDRINTVVRILREGVSEDLKVLEQVEAAIEPTASAELRELLSRTKEQKNRLINP